MKPGNAVVTIDTIDWNDLWEKAVLEASARKRRPDQIKFWDEKAPIYGRMEEAEGIERAQQIVSRLNVGNQTSILDIGCGPGTLAIPLAKVAESVTALDQSQGMLDEVKKRAEREQIKNIRYIRKKWEDAVSNDDIAPHDIVIASYSLDMLDMKAALQKIHEIATQAVCLYWFAGDDSWDYEYLWPQVFNGEKYCTFPSHIYLLNILHQIKIYPNVEVTNMKTSHPFSRLEDAVDYWRDNLQVTSPEQVEIIKRYLLQTMIQENGEFWYHRTMRMCMIWWHKDSYE